METVFNRTLVIGLDGVPYTFLTRLIKEGRMPNMAGLVEKGHLQRINSVYPTVSSVAWASFMTGQNPGGHNLYGFVDRRPNPFRLFIPTAVNMPLKTLWEKLSEAGKKVIVINVPATYPPRKVNGIMIACFLSPGLDKAVFPGDLAPALKNMGYIIDADPWLARESREKFLARLNLVLDKRFETAIYLMKNRPWDFFMLHVMETDRINHFFWRDMETGHPVYAAQFYDFYTKIDGLIGKLLEQSGSDLNLVILSDHGFCSIKKEVYLNYWLTKEGYLKFTGDKPRSLQEIHPDTTAYSLIPGRIYINLKGREEKGSVFINEYEPLCRELKDKILKLKDPDDGQFIFENVFFREEIYSGPYVENAPDLIAVPFNGYEIKGDIDKANFTGKGFNQGMHTFDDAFILFSPGFKKQNIHDLPQAGRFIAALDR